MFGEETLDEIIYPMIMFKGHIVSKSLDGQGSDFKMKRAKDGEEKYNQAVHVVKPKDEEGLMDEKDYFANDKVHHAEKANYEGRDKFANCIKEEPQPA